MSSSRALCCLPSVKKQKHDFHFFSVRYIIKQLLDSVFVISRIGLGKSYQPQPSASADLFITSMITDRIGRHEVLLPINHKN